MNFAQSGFAIRQAKAEEHFLRKALRNISWRIDSSKLKITLRRQREVRRFPPSDS